MILFGESPKQNYLAAGKSVTPGSILSFINQLYGRPGLKKQI